MTNGWKNVPLGEFLVQRKGFFTINDFTRYKRARVQLHARGIVLRDEVDGIEVKTKEQQAARTGDFLVAEIDAKVGGFGIVPPELDNAIVSSHYFLFEINEQKCLREWLDWFIRSGMLEEQVTAQGSTNYSAIRPSHVLKYEIPLPPLTEQRRIVTRIEALAARVTAAQSLRREASEEAEVLVKSQTTILFEKLAHYAKVPLGKLGINETNPIQTGPFGSQLLTNEFVDEGIPVLNVGNVQPEGLNLTRLDHVTPEKGETLSRYSLQENDLLFARTGATLGKVCLLPKGCDGWLMTGHLFRVRFDTSRCNPRYAFVALRGAESIRKQIFGQIRGATRPGFNTTLLSQVELPLPPLPEQQRLVAYLDGLQTQVTSLRAAQAESERALSALMPSILDRAFKGEL